MRAMLHRISDWLMRRKYASAALERSAVDDDDSSIADSEAFGVEILNDASTSMDFVVHVLVTHFGVTYDRAVQIMLYIHTRGSIVVGRISRERAEHLSRVIADTAARHGFSLQSRVVPYIPMPTDLPSSEWP